METLKKFEEFHIRTEVKEGDPDSIYNLAAATGFFTEEENLLAKSLVEETLDQKEIYDFVFMEKDSKVIGYTCFGDIPGTDKRYDLYWIAVHPDFQGMGLGRKLLTATENKVRSCGGKHIYIETSSKPEYLSTRCFYEKTGCQQVAHIDDFYRDGDGKLIYVKKL